MNTKTRREAAGLNPETRAPLRPSESGEAIITKHQVAELLHIHPVTVLRWARLGILPAERVGKTWLFDRVKIEVELLHRKSTAFTP